MSDNGCLSCQHFFVKDSEGNRTSSYQLAAKIRREAIHQTGMCTLNPQWEPKHSDHFCGQHKPEDGLIRTVSDHELIWGNWTANESAWLKKQNAELKARIKRDRARIDRPTLYFVSRPWL
jgi:hypothetical protein